MPKIQLFGLSFVNFKEKFTIFKPKHDFELPQDNCTARTAKSPTQC